MQKCCWLFNVTLTLIHQKQALYKTLTSMKRCEQIKVSYKDNLIFPCKLPNWFLFFISAYWYLRQKKPILHWATLLGLSLCISIKRWLINVKDLIQGPCSYLVVKNSWFLKTLKEGPYLAMLWFAKMADDLKITVKVIYQGLSKKYDTSI